MTATVVPETTTRRASPAWWIGVSIVLVAANLRPAVVAVSPLLEEIQAVERLSGTAAGVLTALPVLCFGLLAPVAPRLAARFGIERTLFGALVVLCLGIALRIVDATAALFAGTVLVGGAIAVGNVLLPGLIKRDFAHRTGLMTGLYTMAITAGGGLAAGLTVPVARAAGLGWHGALGAWGLFALVALLVWSPQAHGAQHRPRQESGSPGGLWRNALAWQVTAFMGLQSLCFYAAAAWLPAVFVSRGADAAAAGWLLSLANGVGIAGSLVAPVVAARLRAQTAVAVAATGVTALGLLGTLLLPGAEIVSMAVFGIGQGAALGIALTLIVLRAPDGAHASQLSGMAQSMGYLLAASGPFMLGALHDLTDSWTVPLVVLLALLAPQALSGGLAGRERFVARRRAPSSGL
ncbi:MAG: major facilitator superfamily 1 [Pseudonocardia sp.]|jgi:CP family cyanate transporter-like MFS transporter|uniref:CynX/NimT family MFS transporter n=1 Tax=Pseudonocardia sp. TaxID=60912 RepID=UPI00260AB976|nr:MFS transporter [Pseudonocardia sp.]MCU1625120.1 major facilitator superfamily 1 [Pseudonocardia sp.]MDT7700715.1 transporter, family, cyanate transporter [Pseudonocardiales bacterium]